MNKEKKSNGCTIYLDFLEANTVSYLALLECHNMNGMKSGGTDIIAKAVQSKKCGENRLSNSLNGATYPSPGSLEKTVLIS